jgi:hypothetical protein
MPTLHRPVSGAWPRACAAVRLSAQFTLPLLIVGLALLSARAQTAPEARNLTLLAHHALNGNGDGGEGMAIQRLPDGRRLLYFAHEGTKNCLSVIDVTQPRRPVLLNTIPSPAPGVTRCNSLGLAGNLLAVADQTREVNQKTAGMWLLDVSDVGRVQKARQLQDLAVSFFDTSGPNSRGVHCLWFVDGEFVHMTTGMPDFTPTHPLDDQFYVIVDVRDPRHPHEVGRWWYPGTNRRDPCLPDCLITRHQPDNGFRPHNIEVWPERPERAYLGYIDGGAIILDISGLADVKAGRSQRFTPKLIGEAKFSPPYTAWTHTFQPIFSRNLAFVSDEAVRDNCQDAPKLVWLLDVRAESNPMVIATAPLHASDGELCKRGRFGAHNLHPNFPNATSSSANLKNTAVAAWFDGGVRIFHVVDGPAGVPNAPPHLEEIGYFIPAGLPGNPHGAANLNHVLVDERGIIFAADRVSGGLYVLKYTGSVPLD